MEIFFGCRRPLFDLMGCAPVAICVVSGLPLGSPQRAKKLSEDYFSMIEAVEFTRHMDDGAHPHRWHEADLVLLGVSRWGLSRRLLLETGIEDIYFTNICVT